MEVAVSLNTPPSERTVARLLQNSDESSEMVVYVKIVLEGGECSCPEKFLGVWGF